MHAKSCRLYADVRSRDTGGGEIRDLLHPRMVGMLSQRPLLAGPSDGLTLLFMLEVVLDQRVALLRGPIRYDFSARFEHLVEVDFPVSEEQRADAGGFEEAHVVRPLFGDVDVVV